MKCRVAAGSPSVKVPPAKLGSFITESDHILAVLLQVQLLVREPANAVQGGANVGPLLLTCGTKVKFKVPGFNLAQPKSLGSEIDGNTLSL